MKGIYTLEDGTKASVAIKLLKEVQNSREMAEFKKEFAIFSAIQSPFTVRFYGAW